MSNGDIRNHAAFIKSIAELLRGTYKQSDYGKVILPLAVIRRLDCVLEPTKDAVLKRAKTLKGKVENVEPVLRSVAGEQFYNISPLTFTRLLDDPNNIAANLRSLPERARREVGEVGEQLVWVLPVAARHPPNVAHGLHKGWRLVALDVHREGRAASRHIDWV